MGKIIFYLVFAGNLLLSGFLGWTLLQTNLVPHTAVLIGLGVLVLIPLLLLLLQREKKGEKKKGGARVAGIVLLLFLSLVEGAVGYYVLHYRQSMVKVTEVNTQVTRVEVYVKESDPVDSVEAAVINGYRFGTIQGADEDAVSQLRGEIEERSGQEVKEQGYSSLMELIRAMDDERVDALLMSEAYLDLIESLPEYEDYKEKLKVLESKDVQTEILQESVTERIPEGIDVSGTMKDPDLWADCFCAYVSGIDTFGPVTTRSRSDVNILAIVNTNTKTVLLISTPRDYYVPFNFAPVNGAMDKLTHAGIYGIEGSMRALSDFYGLPIHYYVRVNFTGFINVIDTLGGVDVESDADVGNKEFYIKKGMNHLNGRAALYFVRNRHDFADGDRARSRHQMAVIKGVINGLMSSKIITNYAQLMKDMEGCFQTNASMTMVGDMVQLTLDRSKGDWKVLTYNVDGNGRTDYAYSLGAYAYCMIPNMKTVEYAQSLASAVIAGESMTQEQLQKNAPSPRGDK